MSVPLVVVVYQRNCTTVAQPPGLGDFLRGCASIHQLSEKLGFELFIDFSQHPLGTYFEAPKRPPSLANTSSTALVQEFFNQRRDKIADFLAHNLHKSKPLLVASHKFPVLPLATETQLFIQQFLRPKPQIEKLVANVQTKLDLTRYCVVHVRTGDHSRSLNLDKLLNYIQDHILEDWKDQVLLLSDNSQIAERLVTALDIKHTNAVPAHTGSIAALPLKTTSQLSPDAILQDTVVDFVLMSRAAAIYAWSAYNWKSGFSGICADIFNIPCTAISLG